MPTLIETKCFGTESDTTPALNDNDINEHGKFWFDDDNRNATSESQSSQPHDAGIGPDLQAGNTTFKSLFIERRSCSASFLDAGLRVKVLRPQSVPSYEPPRERRGSDGLSAATEMSEPEENSSVATILVPRGPQIWLDAQVTKDNGDGTWSVKYEYLDEKVQAKLGLMQSVPVEYLAVGALTFDQTEVNSLFLLGLECAESSPFPCLLLLLVGLFKMLRVLTGPHERHLPEPRCNCNYHCARNVVTGSSI